MKRVYVAGPMSNLPGLNFPAFHAAAAKLRAAGFEVTNPAELCPDPGMAWADCMRRDIAALVTCDEIAMLPGWRQSRGATLEHHIATMLGMPARELPGTPRPAASCDQAGGLVGAVAPSGQGA